MTSKNIFGKIIIIIYICDLRLIDRDAGEKRYENKVRLSVTNIHIFNALLSDHTQQPHLLFYTRLVVSEHRYYTCTPPRLEARHVRPFNVYILRVTVLFAPRGVEYRYVGRRRRTERERELLKLYFIIM